MKREGLKLRGTAVIERRRKDGAVIDREVIKNLVLTLGKSRVRDLIGEGIGATGITGFGYIAIGTGTASPVIGNTALETEVERESATVASVSTDQVTFEKTFTFASGVSYSITEAGVGDSATETGDTLLDRFTFSIKSVDADTDLYVKVTITVS